MKAALLVPRLSRIRKRTFGSSRRRPPTPSARGRSRRYRSWLGFGLLEREGDSLYDSAVLLGPDGSITLKYRRDQPHWHSRAANAGVYRQGTDTGVVETPFGRVGFLICGDLFDDEIVSRFRALRPDLLLFPFARCFQDYSFDQARWDREEMPEYADRVSLAGVPALMVDYIGHPGHEDYCFGGAFFVAADGAVRASLPLGVGGALVVDLGAMLTT